MQRRSAWRERCASYQRAPPWISLMAIDLEHANLPYIYTPPPSPPHALRGDPRRSTAAAPRAPRPSAGITSAIMNPGGGFRDGEAPQEEAGPTGAAANRRIGGQCDSADLRGTTT